METVDNYLVYPLFLAGLVSVVKGADWLVKGGSDLARKFHVSNLIIGLTVVAFGTSLPEFAVSLTAALHKNSDIAIGNILGSNIANVLLILGISSLIRPLSIHESAAWKEIPLGILAACALAFMALDGTLSSIEAAVLLAAFLGYVASIFKSKEEKTTPPATVHAEERRKEMRHSKDKHGGGVEFMKAIGSVVIGLAALVLGGNLVVDQAVNVARSLGISDAVTGLTVVAVGTSLPELATSTVAAYRGYADIAVGNIIGSNLFNILFVLGFTGIIQPVSTYEGFPMDVSIATASSILLFLMSFVGKRFKIERWQGALLFFSYIAYVMHLISR